MYLHSFFSGPGRGANRNPGLDHQPPKRMEIKMNTNPTPATYADQLEQRAPAVRERACPLCDTSPGQPCQPKPQGDHLARYLDAYTAGQLTKAYMGMTLGELVVIDAASTVIPAQRGGAR